MSKIYESIEELVGNTPLVHLGKLESELNLKAKILAKIESMNPCGSVKDRAALGMIYEAEREGILKPGSVIIEPTSGNTGIGLAAYGKLKGYRVIIVLPDSMSVERRMLLGAYGAELVLTDGALGMKGAICKAEELVQSINGAILAGQFTNPSNPEAHYNTTGSEIWNDTEGSVDILVATAGTGGTVSGTGRYLKEKNPEIKVVAVEPAASPFLTEGHSGAHKIQGIGAGFLPKTLDLSLIDEVLTVTDDEAFEATRKLAKIEGILVGISSGAAISAAISVAKRPENAGKNIVVILPDTGERYLSSGLFE
jgi:cysteine synthase A